MAKPTVAPVFVSELPTATHVTAPSGTQPTEGYSTGYQPGAYEHNYLFGWLCKWAGFLNGLISSEGAGVVTWLANDHRFTGVAPGGRAGFFTGAAGTSLGGHAADFISGLCTTGLGGFVSIFGGPANGAGGTGGPGAYIQGGAFTPTVTTDDGVAGLGLELLGGTVRTDGILSVVQHGLKITGGSLRNAANTAYQKGSIQSALLVVPGRKKNAAGAQVLGNGIHIQDLSAGAAQGGPGEGVYALVADAEYAAIKLDRGGYYLSDIDLRDTLTPQTIGAVSAVINAAASPGFAGIGINAITYPSATVMRVAFGNLSGAYNMNNANYVAIISTLHPGGAGTINWKIVDKTIGYIDLSLCPEGSTTAQVIDTGAFNSPTNYQLQLIIQGIWD